MLSIPPTRLKTSVTNPSSIVICTYRLGNLSEQVGVPPGVGFGCGHIEVLGEGSESA